MTTPLITAQPLPTTFTLLPGCFTNITWYQQASGLGTPATIGPIENCSACWLGLPQSPDCFSRNWNPDALYSPGVCPSGYFAACASTYIAGSNTQTETTCCPSGFLCQNYATYGEYWPWFSNKTCTSPWGTRPITALTVWSATYDALTVVSGSTTTRSIVLSTFSDSVVYPETALSGLDVYAYVISILSQSSSVVSKTGTVMSTTSSVISTASSTMSMSSNSSLSSSPILSTEEKAGIGIAVGVFFVGFVAVLLLLWHRRRRWRRRSRQQDEYLNARQQEHLNPRRQEDLGGRPESTDGHPHGLFLKPELNGKLSPPAPHGSPQMAELETRPNAQKLPAQPSAPVYGAELALKAPVVSRRPVPPGHKLSSDNKRFHVPSSPEAAQNSSSSAGSGHDLSSIHQELSHIGEEREI